MTQTTFMVLTSYGNNSTYNGDSVRIADLDTIDGAYPTSRCLDGTDDYWAAAEYVERMIDRRTGKQYDVVYLFEADDMEYNGEPRQWDDYPWGDRIARVVAVCDDER